MMKRFKPQRTLGVAGRRQGEGGGGPGQGGWGEGAGLYLLLWATVSARPTFTYNVTLNITG